MATIPVTVDEAPTGLRPARLEPLLRALIEILQSWRNDEQFGAPCRFEVKVHTYADDVTDLEVVCPATSDCAGVAGYRRLHWQSPDGVFHLRAIEAAACLPVSVDLMDAVLPSSGGTHDRELQERAIGVWGLAGLTNAEDARDFCVGTRGRGGNGKLPGHRNDGFLYLLHQRVASIESAMGVGEDFELHLLGQPIAGLVQVSGEPVALRPAGGCGDGRQRDRFAVLVEEGHSAPGK